MLLNYLENKLTISWKKEIICIYKQVRFKQKFLLKERKNRYYNNIKMKNLIKAKIF